jgi:deferrochelatase/peroxidase EfeB
MTHALVTIVAPLHPSKLADVTTQISALGNPASADLRECLDLLDETDGQSGTHFVSLHAIPASNGKTAYIVLEFSADGTEEQALVRLERAIGIDLKPIFLQAEDWPKGSAILPYLRNHMIRVGHGLFSAPGVAFAGTPGMTVGRIRMESKLAAEVTRILGEPRAGRAGMRAIDRLAAVRTEIAADPKLARALAPPPPPLPEHTATLVSILPQLIFDFARTFLWPVGLVLLLWTILAGAAAHMAAPGLWPIVVAAVSALWSGAITLLIVFLIVAAYLYFALLRASARDFVDSRWPDQTTLAEILKRENFAAQNHMVSVTERKPGIMRALTIRLVFWIVTELVAKVYQPGFLSNIGTIHFARWVTVPGTRDFLFFSNYAGSWESYLEDFITRAHYGLTAVWSNSVGFPRTHGLINGGAADGERFKRYARRSMLPTPFWYSAYPDTTTAHVRTNAKIRRGLASALTNEEALDWLALFGSVVRPDAKLESSEIQSLVFGGLGFLPFGICLFYRLSDNPDSACRFLARLKRHVAFSDGRRLQSDAVITLGVGPNALAKLGLPAECVNGFPVAFLNGMAHRARLLGDIEANAPENWQWGRHESPDVAILVYGTSPQAVTALETQIESAASAHGAVRRFRIALKDVVPGKSEPFGFADGISQPVIRGTYKGLRRPDPIHIVEPGEFLIGYPDNRGNIPLGPTLPAAADPHNRLPIAAENLDFGTNIVNQPRDLGRNGTFLVIRQLAQDVEGFEKYCTHEADKLRDRLAPPYRIDPDFIAAKLIGRWKDGSSLVRNPYKPASEEVTGSDQLKAISRPKTHPDDKPPIEPANRPSGRPDNDFLFGEEDPEALRCPYGAHIRRANPRDSFDPGSRTQIDISNRHRILRVGRFYEPEPGQNPGLLFMCLNGDLERQFEFIQQTWLNSPSFHGLVGEQDPVVGGEKKACTGYLIPSRDGPVRLGPLERFVTMQGGGYFFLPSRRLLEFLSGDE